MASDLPGFRQLSYLSLEDALRPHDGAQVWVERWWVVDPAKGLVFYGSSRSPQCNQNWLTAKLIRRTNHPDAELRFLPLVFLPPLRDSAWVAGGNLDWPSRAPVNVETKLVPVDPGFFDSRTHWWRCRYCGLGEIDLPSTRVERDHAITHEKSCSLRPAATS